MPLVIDQQQIEKLLKRRKSRRTQPVRPSAVAERALRQKMSLLWKRSIFPAIKRIEEAIKAGVDGEQLSELLDNELTFAQLNYDQSASDIADMFKLVAAKEHKDKLARGLTKTLGIDISAVLDSTVVAEAMDMGSREAADLIRTIPSDLHEEVKRAVMDNFRGTPLPEGRTLLQQIRHIHDVSYKRAKVIARDQTGKMNSLLNQTRQQSLGVDEYIWRTSKDSRVVGNPSGKYPSGSDMHGNHWIMEGKHCKWSDASVYSDDGKNWKKRTGAMPKGHVGSEILCRCYAESVIDINKLDLLAA